MPRHPIVFQSGLLILLVILSACVPYPYTKRAPVYEVNRPHSNEASGVDIAPTVRGPEAIPMEIVPARAPARPAEKAVENLLETAWRHYRNDDFYGAIAVAERAQRLDGRSAEVYLVLAASYFSQGKAYAAKQFAQRGLSFSAGGSDINKKLVQLLAELAP